MRESMVEANFPKVLESVATVIRIIKDLLAPGVRCNSRTLDFLWQQVEKLEVLPGLVRCEPAGKQLSWWNVLHEALTRGKTLIENHTRRLELQSIYNVSNVAHQVEGICADLEGSLVALKLGHLVRIDTRVAGSRVAKDMIYMEWYLKSISEKDDNGFRLNEHIWNELRLLKIRNDPQMQQLHFIEETDIAWGSPLGRGQFGEVFKAHWSGVDVAVKIVSLQLDRLPVEAFTEYLTDVGIHMWLTHKNVAHCFAATKTGCIVLQLADQNVQDLYQKDDKLRWGVKLSIMVQAADGLRYLHEQGILHQAFTCTNLLVYGKDLKSCKIKVTDFGYPRIRKEAARWRNGGQKGEACRWMAPEVQEGRPHTPKSDVFSFGVAMLELAAQALPYQNLSPTQMLGRKQRWGDPCPELRDCPNDLKELLGTCIDPTSYRRPSMATVCAGLEKLKTQADEMLERLTISESWHRAVSPAAEFDILKTCPVRLPSSELPQDLLTKKLSSLLSLSHQSSDSASLLDEASEHSSSISKPSQNAAELFDTSVSKLSQTAVDSTDMLEDSFLPSPVPRSSQKGLKILETPVHMFSIPNISKRALTTNVREAPIQSSRSPEKGLNTLDTPVYAAPMSNTSRRALNTDVPQASVHSSRVPQKSSVADAALPEDPSSAHIDEFSDKPTLSPFADADVLQSIRPPIGSCTLSQGSSNEEWDAQVQKVLSKHLMKEHAKTLRQGSRNHGNNGSNASEQARGGGLRLRLQLAVKEERKTLASAIRQGDSVSVKKLLTKGANVETRDKDGLTALMIAAEEGHLQIFHMLIDHGASINARNKLGATPLMIAALEGRAQIVSGLLDIGADIEARDWEGDTALTIACFEGHFNVADILLNKGASLQAHDENGNTALHCAAMNGHIAVVKLLMTKGANKKIRNKAGFFRGDTAASIAKKNGYTDVVQLIKQW